MFERISGLLWRFVSHPITKRMALATPFNVGIAMTFSFFGRELEVIELLFLAVATYFIADAILSDRYALKENWRNIKSLLKNYLPKTVIMISALAFFYGTRHNPSEDFVQRLFNLVESIGFMAFTMFPVIRAALNSHPTHGIDKGSVLLSFVYGLTAYTAALWVIGEYGDGIYKWVITNPTDVALLVSSLVVCRIIIMFTVRPASLVHALQSGGVVANSRLKPAPTDRDNRFIAAHETGHALVYAALGKLPANLSLVMNIQDSEDGALGFITSITTKHRLDDKVFAEWHMLTMLAGKLGESFAMGSNTLGSISDHQRWLSTARIYLANHYRGVFYFESQNLYEQQQNDIKLKELQAEQSAMVLAFFEANAEVFKQISDKLLEMKTMKSHDLIPFLNRVTLPDEFPLPFGPFDKMVVVSGDEDMA